MKMSSGSYSELNAEDRKLYAFCAGGVTAFYDERLRIGGRAFAYCHVLGELVLQVCRLPSMSFLPPERREEHRRLLCERAKHAMSMIRTDEGVTRDESRQIVDLAVEDFSAKGRARDMQFIARSFAVKPDLIDDLRLQQNYPHEYSRFKQRVRQRVLAGPKG